MSEITHSPTEILFHEALLPKLPKPVVAAFRANKKAHDAWTAAYVELTEAYARVEPAELADAQAVRDAAAKGQTAAPMGRIKAEREVAMHEEIVRVAREAATVETDKLRAVVDQHGREVIEATIAHMRESAATYSAVLAEASARVNEAATVMQNSATGLRMASRWLSKECGINGEFDASVQRPTFPVDDVSHRVEHIVTRLNHHGLKVGR